MPVGESKGFWIYGTFEHFQPCSIFKFQKTASPAFWERHKPVVSHRVQLTCAIFLALMRLLLIWTYKC